MKSTTAFSLITPKIKLAYSIKANYHSKVIEMAKDNHLGFDCASFMELNKLINLEVPVSDIWINTPYLNQKLLRKCIALGVTVYADSLDQIAQIRKEAIYLNKRVNIGIRFNFPETGWSRFGVESSEESVNAVCKLFDSSPLLTVTTLHTHFSGALRDARSFAQRAGALYLLYQEWFKKYPITRFNIGGGISGSMPDELAGQFEYPIPTWEAYAKAVYKALPEFDKTGLQLVLEPGMALVANTFFFLAEVLQIKKIKSKRIALLNTSKIFLKPTNHAKALSFRVFTKDDSPEEIGHYDLAGITCMESDLLGNYTGTLNAGDLILFNNVGAYTLSYRPDFIFEEPEIVYI